MNENKNNFTESEINIYLLSSLFSTEAIFKALYWHSDKFISQLNQITNDLLHLRLEPIENLTYDEMKIAYSEINRNIIDFQLRQIIHAETKNIKDLLTAKAFANGQLDELPKGDISDPVGFIIN